MVWPSLHSAGTTNRLSDLSAAIERAPRNAIPYFNRAEVLQRLGQSDKAIADFNEAVRLDPRLAAAYAAIARLREENGQRDRAIHDYDMALRLDPKQVSLYFRPRERARGRPATGAVPLLITIRRWLSTRSGRIPISPEAGRGSHQASGGADFDARSLHFIARLARSVIPLHGRACRPGFAAGRATGRRQTAFSTKLSRISRRERGPPRCFAT